MYKSLPHSRRVEARNRSWDFGSVQKIPTSGGTHRKARRFQGLGSMADHTLLGQLKPALKPACRDKEYKIGKPLHIILIAHGARKVDRTLTIPLERYVKISRIEVIMARHLGRGSSRPTSQGRKSPSALPWTLRTLMLPEEQALGRFFFAFLILDPDCDGARRPASRPRAQWMMFMSALASSLLLRLKNKSWIPRSGPTPSHCKLMSTWCWFRSRLPIP